MLPPTPARGADRPTQVARRPVHRHPPLAGCRAVLRDRAACGFLHERGFMAEQVREPLDAG
jgi:hypothetical protein